MNVNSPLTHQQLPKTKPGIEAHFFITSIYQSRVESMRIQRREKLKLLLKGFWGPSAPAKAQPAFEANAFDLINVSRQSFSQGELNRGSNLNYHCKDSRAHQHLLKPSQHLRLML